MSYLRRFKNLNSDGYFCQLYKQEFIMTTRKVTFLLPNYIVRGAESGVLLGDFNNWNIERAIELTKTEHGDLTVTVELISGEFYQYRYFLSDGRWENDDNAQSYHGTNVEGVENCVVFVGAAEEYQTEQKKTIKKTAKKAVGKPARVKVEKTTSNAKTINTAKEDLSVLAEISKSTADLLNQKGINTFSRLAKSTIKSLKELLEDAGPKYEKLNPSAWPKAAKAHLAANPTSKTKDAK